MKFKSVVFARSWLLVSVLVPGVVLPSFSHAVERSFNEVKEVIYAQPLQELPDYSRFSIADALKSVARFNTALMDRAGLTVSDPSDLMDPAPKVLHPMGVCADAEWEIDTPSGATGLLSPGTKVKGIVRLSVASNDVKPKKDTNRVIAIGVKLFPTTNTGERVTTANFLTADQTGLDGSPRQSFFFGDRPEDKIYFSNFARGDGFAAKLGFILFDRIDGPSNFRAVYPLTEVTSSNQPVERPMGPTELRLVPRIARKLNPLPADFRDEIRSYKAGEMKFDIVIPKQPDANNQNRVGWLDLPKKIGTMTLGAPVVSVACDQQLHFHHHPQNRSLNQSQTQKKDLHLDQNERPETFRYKNGKQTGTTSNRWEHVASPFRDNVLFHEVKYFNFATPSVTGAITYMVMSPKTGQELVVSAYVVSKDKGTKKPKISVVRKSYPLSCVVASHENVQANLCNEGQITALDSGKIKVVQSVGPIKWDLVFDARESERTSAVMEVDFSQTLPLDLKADRIFKSLRGWFNWVPTFRSSTVSGHVRIDGADGKNPETLQVSADNGYHDQHWGVWLPDVQPMRWVHFTGIDSTRERIDVSLGEFPKNRDPRAGLTVYHNGKKTYWPPGKYRVDVLVTEKIQLIQPVSTPEGGFAQKDAYTALLKGDHPIAKKIRITTLETPTPHLEVELNTTSAIGIDAGSATGFVLNEQNVDVKVKKFIDSSGRERTAQGPGFYMETSSR